MVTTQQGKNFVHELLMEYIKQNNILQCDKELIPERINQIVEVENIISENVQKKYHNISFIV
ncbi:hypothetical protein [Roseburia sp. 1XD42-69]|uniref:hypothetical protein n=1 Tax=Roseburia sp. 1XD42-69 TaxID=2320088 RepID=UPI000EA13768|nr:hypothetical protein [Roseburia sp. 1XD42-69]RKJ68905.1 hypothetical protein D7Y06_01250 [Roseburia sp. 1XD42-69]